MCRAYSFCARGAGTLETGSIDSAFRVDAILKNGTIRPLVVELESFKEAPRPSKLDQITVMCTRGTMMCTRGRFENKNIHTKYELMLCEI